VEVLAVTLVVTLVAILVAVPAEVPVELAVLHFTANVAVRVSQDLSAAQAEHVKHQTNGTVSVYKAIR